MEGKKDNKSITGVLFTIIVLLLLVILYLLFGNKVLNKCNDYMSITTENTSSEIENSDYYLKDIGEGKNLEQNFEQNENLLNTLNKKSFDDLNPIYECTENESNCEKDYFIDNNKKVYVNLFNYWGQLSLTKNDVHDEEIDYSDRLIEIYKIKNYYVSLLHAPAGGSGQFKLYDNNINLVYSSSWSDQVIYYSDDIIYYGVASCEILRPDEKIGMGIVVYEYNLENRTNKHLFNLNHDAGWAC